MAPDDGSKKDEKENSADLKGLLEDTREKVFTAGVSAAFMTEESLKRVCFRIEIT